MIPYVAFPLVGSQGLSDGCEPHQQQPRPRKHARRGIISDPALSSSSASLFVASYHRNSVLSARRERIRSAYVNNESSFVEVNIHTCLSSTSVEVCPEFLRYDRPACGQSIVTCAHVLVVYCMNILARRMCV